jgi:hypothetical protein
MIKIVRKQSRNLEGRVLSHQESFTLSLLTKRPFHMLPKYPSGHQSPLQAALLATPSRPFSWGAPPPDFDPKKDYYKVLEVKDSASGQEVKHAFYRLAQFYHPDRNGGVYQDKFKEITAAYQVLSDEKKRKRYDALRKGQPDPEGMRNPFQGWGQQNSSS